MVSGNTPQRAAGRDRPSGAGAAAPPQGLSWSWKLDYDEAPAAAEGPAIPAEALAGNIAEHLSAGPALAGWLALAPPDQLDDRALAGVLASWRRLASWAQAGELAVAAQIASRAAARDDKIAVAADGRPAQVPGDAASEVALALAMSQYGASWWTDLAVTLTWRLAATGAALRAGDIDLYRARLIAEATAVLDDEVARAVEAQVLPDAGFQTT